MRTFKMLTVGIILAVMGVFVWQNIPVFKTTLPFTLNLYVREQMSWSHQLYTLLLLTGVLGFLVGILLMLKPYFNVRRLLAQERQERQQATAAHKTPFTSEETTGEASTEKTAEDQ